ncbi:hypothetical protein ACFE04_026297 [Oxalis oulophora]
MEKLKSTQHNKVLALATKNMSNGPKDMETVDVMESGEVRLEKFKRVDIVKGSSKDHTFGSFKSSFGKSLTNCKQIIEEWKVLESQLPDSIYVRGYEERADLIQAMIVGPPGTPYQNGLFFFDLMLLDDYPTKPPLVHYKYHLSGFGLNPDLHPWTPVLKNLNFSTILEVLLWLRGSLSGKPYYYFSQNEEDCQIFNFRAFVASCRTMIRVMKYPPKHFEDFVVQHFGMNRELILRVCKAYSEGRAHVGFYEDGNFEMDPLQKVPRRLKKQMVTVYTQLKKAISGQPVSRPRLWCLNFIEEHYSFASSLARIICLILVISSLLNILLVMNRIHFLDKFNSLDLLLCLMLMIGWLLLVRLIKS